MIARAILRASRQSLSNRDVLTRIGWPTLAWIPPEAPSVQAFLDLATDKGPGSSTTGSSSLFVDASKPNSAEENNQR